MTDTVTAPLAEVGTAEAAALAKVGATAKDVQASSNGVIVPAEEKTPAQGAAEAKAKAEAEATAKAAAAAETPEGKRKAAEAAEAAAKAAKDAADAATAEERKDWQGQYVKIEHPAAQAAIDLLSEAGVTPVEANAIFEEAIKSADISKVDWTKLEAKIGKAKTELVKAGVTQYDNEVVQNIQAVKKSVLEIAGGQENWDKITAWAKAREKTDPVWAKQLVQYRNAIEVGGLVTQQVATALKAEYNKDPKNNGLGVTTIVNGQALPAGVEGALTRAAYVDELKKAHERNASPAEIKALDARRVLGRQQRI